MGLQWARARRQKSKVGLPAWTGLKPSCKDPQAYLMHILQPLPVSLSFK